MLNPASYNIKFEQACLIFNLAALKSQVGGHSDKSSDEGLKKSAAEFQEAAGLFEYLQNELAPHVFGPARSTDISENGLKMAIYTMLGQAQSCVFAKAKLVRFFVMFS